MALELIEPRPEHLAAYSDALHRGWSPISDRPEARNDQLTRIEADPQRFLADQTDPEGRGPPIVLPDGSSVKRLPSYRRWIWDDGFCGAISLRWQPGTAELPPTCLGHIGYGVVPWKRGNGYATRALALILPLARTVGLPYAEITTDVSNLASQRVIEKNGGVFVERFRKPEALGGADALRYRIDLSSGAASPSIVDPPLPPAARPR